MKTKHVIILSAFVIVSGIGVYKFATFARDYPREATWGIVFYGMIFVLIALPVGIVALIARGLSKRRTTQTLAGHEDRPNDDPHA